MTPDDQLVKDITWLVQDLVRKRSAYARLQRRKKTKENDALMATYRESMARIKSQIMELLGDDPPT